ncbi:MAG: malto-oligosyltrehalose trehalohydrolase, partial [Pseudomonadota bacterium]
MSACFSHSLPWGAELTESGARFRLWAPAQRTLSLRTADGTTIPMARADDGWFELVTGEVPAGGGYQFVLQDGLAVPDPAARAQISDVHGMSRLV